MTVYVVTDPDLGWCCIIGVFSNEEDAEACVEDRGSGIIHQETLQESFTP